MSKYEEEKKETLSRRRFLKASSALGAGAAIASISTAKNPKKGTAFASSIIVKEQDDFPIEVAPDYQRFNQKNQMWMRGLSGEPGSAEDFFNYAKRREGKGTPPPDGSVGYTELDAALGAAAWSIENDFSHGSGAGLCSREGMYNWESPINERKTTFSSSKEASKIIKKATKYLGADLVGIAKYEDVEKWVYSHWTNPLEGIEIPAEFPFKPKSVVVMAFEMDYLGFQACPTLSSEASTAHGYADMAITAHKVGVFLRRLGYQAIPTGNDTALNIPIAIQAGLGELGRMGMLITEQYGARVRIAKVFTDLELEPDKPITFGVHEFCKTCMKCADNCPSESIPKDVEPSFKVYNRSNLVGVKKWNVNAETCLHFLGENGTSCGCCLAVCPYNKIDEWHHDLSRLATVIPGVRNLAREFDELFGYGKVFNDKAVKEFWEKLEE